MEGLVTSINIKDEFTSKINSMINTMIEFENRINSFADKATNSFNRVNQEVEKIKNNMQGIKTPKIKVNTTDITKGIVQTNEKLKQFKGNTEDSSEKSVTAFGKMKESIKGVIGFINDLGYFVISVNRIFDAFVKPIFALSDRITNIDAKLNLITNTEEEKKKLNDLMKIKSNQLGVKYTDFADNSIKLRQLAGDAFKNNNEAVRFNELMQKAFRISGTNENERRSAMLQMTQALGSGKLQGDEFRSIMENAPMVGQAIAKAMNVPFGQLKDLSKKGFITANIVKNALFNMADELDAKFKKMPLTWSQIGNIMQNKFIQASEKILLAINKVANNKSFMKFINDIGERLSFIFEIAGNIFSGLGAVITGLIDTFQKYKKIISGLAIAFLLYLSLVKSIVVWKMILKGVEMAGAIVTAIQTAAISAYETAVIMAMYATEGWAGAQIILNHIMMMNPIGLIILAITALIGTIYLIVQAINYFTASSISFFGVLAATVVGIVGAIYNGFVTFFNFFILLYNNLRIAIISIAEFIVNMFHSPLQALKNYTMDAVLFVLRQLKWLASAIDTVTFGKTHLTASVEKAESWAESKKSYTGNMVKFDRNYGGIGNLKGMSLDTVSGAYNWGANFGQKKEETVDKIDENDEANKALKNIDKNTKGTEKNTGKTAKNTEESWKEDLEFLGALAIRSSINSLTTPTFTLEMKNEITVNGNGNDENLVNMLSNKLVKDIKNEVQNGFIPSINSGVGN